MSVELKNWKELCKEKDERIKELEGKFDLIVERLEEDKSDWNDNYNVVINRAIKIVKGVMNERD